MQLIQLRLVLSVMTIHQWNFEKSDDRHFPFADAIALDSAEAFSDRDNAKDFSATVGSTTAIIEDADTAMQLTPRAIATVDTTAETTGSAVVPFTAIAPSTDSETHSFVSKAIEYNTFFSASGQHRRRNSIMKNNLNKLIEKLKYDTITLRDLVTELLVNGDDSCDDCRNQNYDECQSELPNAECLITPSYFSNSTCSLAGFCASKFDYTVSTVRLPGVDPRSGAIDVDLVESICRTTSLAKKLKEWWDNDQTYWDENFMSVRPVAMHFGSHSGMHRIYPARGTIDDSCNTFDPRYRPWYQAATTGRKNIILVIDLSETIGNTDSNRLERMKRALHLVIETLTLADRVGLVLFHEYVNITTQKLITPNTNNKKMLNDVIDRLVANIDFGANYSSALNHAIEMIDNSKSLECSTAIMLFTDGVERKVNSAMQSLESIQQRLDAFSNITKIFFFVYSFSELNQQSRQILPSCNSKQSFRSGLWVEILEDDQITQGLSNYFQLFQVGHQKNMQWDDVYFVEPYNFFTFATLGTTASAAIYKNSTSTTGQTVRKLLGVVGVDFTIVGFKMALNDNDVSVDDISYVVKEFRDTSTTCPAVDEIDTPCELEFYSDSNNRLALCSTSCIDQKESFSPSSNLLSTSTTQPSSETEGISTIAPSPELSHSPSMTCVDTLNDLWNNLNHSSLPSYLIQPYSTRVCCNSSTDNKSNTIDQCLTTNPPPEIATGKNKINGKRKTIIIALVVGVLSFLGCIICVWKQYKTSPSSTSIDDLSQGCQQDLSLKNDNDHLQSPADSNHQNNRPKSKVPPDYDLEELSSSGYK